MDGCRGGGDEEWGKEERDRWEDEISDGFRQEEMKRCKVEKWGNEEMGG